MTDLRYWKNVDDIPTGVPFVTADEWECIWVETGLGVRKLCYVERVPVAWRNEVVDIEDEEDAEAARECGPFLEVES